MGGWTGMSFGLEVESAPVPSARQLVSADVTPPASSPSSLPDDALFPNTTNKYDPHET